MQNEVSSGQSEISDSQVWLQAASRLGPVGRIALLLGLAALMLLVIGPLAWRWRGIEGVWAVAAAIAACLAGGLAALGTLLLPSSVQNVPGAVMLGMLVRMGVPLAICVVVALECPMLMAGGFGYFLPFVYMPILAVETLLSVADVSSNAPKA